MLATSIIELNRFDLTYLRVCIGYENSFQQYSRPYQFIKYLIWAGSSAWTYARYGKAAMMNANDGQYMPESHERWCSFYAAQPAL